MFIEYLSDKYIKYHIFCCNFDVKSNLKSRYYNFKERIPLPLVSILKITLSDDYEPVQSTLFQLLNNLTLGFYFNQPITLPQSLKELGLNCHFNQPIILPPNLKILRTGCDFNQPITLPQSLKEFHSNYEFNQPIVLLNH